MFPVFELSWLLLALVKCLKNSSVWFCLFLFLFLFQEGGEIWSMLLHLGQTQKSLILSEYSSSAWKSTSLFSMCDLFMLSKISVCTIKYSEKLKYSMKLVVLWSSINLFLCFWLGCCWWVIEKTKEPGAMPSHFSHIFLRSERTVRKIKYKKEVRF